MAAQLGATTVVLSDCLAPLLRNLELNVRLNVSAGRMPPNVVRVCAMDARVSTGSLDSSRLTMEECVQTQHHHCPNQTWLSDDERFDVLIGSEVLYEKYHGRAMAFAVARHLRLPSRQSTEPQLQNTEQARAYIMYHSSPTLVPLVPLSSPTLKEGKILL